MSPSRPFLLPGQLALTIGSNCGGVPPWIENSFSQMANVSSKRCIIADDVRASREMLAAWMTELDYHAMMVPDGEAARVEAEQIQPHLIITDIEMPRCNGLELLLAIRNHTDAQLRNTPVIVVSSLQDERIVDLVSRFDATCVLSKPLEKLRVKSVVVAIETGHYSFDTLSHIDLAASNSALPAISPKLRRMVDNALREFR